MLSFHKYWNNNTVGDISGHLALREKYNIPIWLGESGENSNLWFTDAIQLVESQGIGWAWWPLKKLGFNNPLEIKPNADYLKVVDHLNGKGEKPSVAVVKKALLQLAEDVRFENNQFHPEVIDAMFRQPYSHASLPFKQHRIKKSGGTVLAVDFDLGRSGVAYWDSDSANYHVSTGKERTPWNRGTTYRNEGVDIEFDAERNSYVVNHIEAGEWLEYTLQVDNAGTYELAAVVKAPNGDGKMSVSVNNQNLNADVNVPASQNYQSVTISGVKLLQGANRLRFYSKSGAYNLHSLVLHP